MQCAHSCGDAASGIGAGDGDDDRLEEWRRLWEDTYRRESVRYTSATFNTAGWTSSYTRRPIPPAEMREWLDHTVERIGSLRPTRVCETGCGSGMLLCRVAPSCARYLATDLCAAAIEYVTREHLAGSGAMDHVTVMQGAAHELGCLPDASVDTVILNSVVQYFPNVDYLIRVLDESVRGLGGHGALFVRRARSLQVTEVLLHTDVPGTFEHHVLEQVGEPGSPAHFVAGADVVPDVHGHDLGGPIRRQDHGQPVW